MALPELFANSPTPGALAPITTLSGAVAATATTLPTSGPAPTALQGSGQFRIVVDSEIMLVTAGAATTSWTVQRGVEGSAAVAHSAGAGAYHYLTAGALKAQFAQLGTDSTIGGPGGSPLSSAILTTSSPVASAVTWNVGASATVLQNKLVSTDAYPAFAITGNGQMQWGSGGSAAPDVYLSRTSSGGYLGLATVPGGGTIQLAVLNPPSITAPSGVTNFQVGVQGQGYLLFYPNGTVQFNGTLQNIVAANEVTTATAGSATISGGSAPLGFLVAKNNAGTTIKIPYYAA